MIVARYIKEFASAQRKALQFNKLMNPGIKAELLRRIDNALKMRERGFITASEAIRLVGGFIESGEDMTEYMI